MVDEIEALFKKQGNGLTRSETKTLVQFLDADTVFVCGYSEKPKQVNFYFQPLYDEPQVYAKLEKTIKPYLKGKSCLHLPKDDKNSLEVVKGLLEMYRNR